MKKKNSLWISLILVVGITGLLNNCSTEEEITANRKPDNFINYFKPDSGSMRDQDGNIYKTIIIGSQTWMNENLRTTKYNDNTDIVNITDAQLWSKSNTSAYCWYNNDSATYKNPFGALYNWDVVNSDMLCPIGWHVPSDEEWITLENYLIACGFNYDGTITGDRFSNNKIAKSMADTTYWNSSPNLGAVGNDDFPDKRNSTGFFAHPGGCRSYNGSFTDFGDWSYWWTSTSSNKDYAWFRYLQKDCPNITRYDQVDNKRNGFPVRCLKD